ncbi:hypothetical protein AM588_10002652 [Phytophthora nicotianae]|uniref:Uncharacterized protein n=1 Tax=Phytophthora nicotianae TaxID=4792 RepID=A0A0W8CZ66_PHYNI|nr:hypothetical protein AM588_10002652 [Phytophthora nicotianae]
MGVHGRGSYGKDMWNVLDFFVVVSSLVASLPGMPNVSAIRTIRVLRPLRSLSVIPGMRRLIAALLKALPALGNVVILQIFVFFIFGILGIQLFGGSMNRRCRLTSFPVKLPLDDMNEAIWPVPKEYIDQVKMNEEAYFCIDAPLLDYEDSAGDYTKETSPWNTPQSCFWPVDDEDEFLCAAKGQAGNHACNIGKTCGSDYDAFGNPRFSHHKAMDYALYRPSLDWGLTTFDNIGRAFFTIFQSITQEGWTVIMYMFFGNTMRFDEEGYPTPFNLEEFWNGTVPRNNFDTLLWAAVTVFQIITGENWNSIMYYAILGNGMLSCVYFISLVILGDFVLMNLFLALLLDNFGDNDEEQEKEKQEETKKLAQKMSVMNMSMKVAPITSESERTMTSRGSFLMVSTAFPLGARRQSILEVDEDGDEEDVRVVNLERFADELTPSVPLAKTVYIETPARMNPQNGSTTPRVDKLSNFEKSSLRDMVNTARNSILASSRASLVSAMMLGTGNQAPDEETQDDSNNPLTQINPGRSLFLFAVDSKVRRIASYLSTHRHFDSTVFGLIVVSSIALAVDNPLADPNSGLATFLKGLDKALAIVFAIEMVIKIVAMGLIMHKGAYLRNGWNIIDCVIVVSSIIMLVAESSGKGANLKSLRSLRGLRTFRPLRMISRRPGLKLVVNALFEAIPEVINVLFVCLLEVPLYEGEYVYFRDVLLAMTREMVKVNAGTISDMPPDQDPGITGVPGAKRRIEFFAHQYFGARRIQRQVAEWLRIKRQLEKKYMEEYKNKIKKPSGRPKKQRDARVFTIG